MIIDSFLQFTGLAVATNIGNTDGTDSPTTGTQTSSNAIDLHMSGFPVLTTGQGARDMGIGDDPSLKVMLWVTTAFSGATSMTVAIQGAPDNGNGAPGTWTTWWTSPAYTEASLVQGAMLFNIDLPRPPSNQPLPRFIQLQYVTTGTHGVGKLRGAIVLDRFDQPSQAPGYVGAYPAGITIAN